ncbi:MAG TPA: rhodanese-like domain-containing protein [Saprospiraceae bacterium]|nr:rhodanese-like domain-containing protein [Saprospiraceae bacterium]
MFLSSACNSQSAKAVDGESSFYKNVDVKAFNSEIGKEGTVLIDVRTPKEFASGHIKGAKNMNLFDPSFASQIGKLDKSKTYLLYCRSGNRSGKAMGTMKSIGISKIYNLAGGMGAWGRAGMPVE